MNIAIVEDEKEDQTRLLNYLEQYQKENNKKFQIHVFRDGDEITQHYSCEYDLILMDIEMALQDGMSAAREIRKTDNEVVILFITNAPQYVMKGYEVGALDYLLKPVDYFAFSARMDIVCRRFNQRQTSFVKLSVKGGFQKVEVSHIRYLETDNREVIYHTLEGDYRTRDTIQTAEALLSSSLFFRCNKCYLINLSFVDGMRGNDVIIGDDIIQVSRTRKKPFLDAWNQYMSEMGI